MEASQWAELEVWKEAEKAQGQCIGQEEELKFGRTSPQQGERKNPPRDPDSDWIVQESQSSGGEQLAEEGPAQGTSEGEEVVLALELVRLGESVGKLVYKQLCLT